MAAQKWYSLAKRRRRMQRWRTQASKRFRAMPTRSLHILFATLSSSTYGYTKPVSGKRKPAPMKVINMSGAIRVTHNPSPAWPALRDDQNLPQAHARRLLMVAGTACHRDYEHVLIVSRSPVRHRGSRDTCRAPCCPGDGRHISFTRGRFRSTCSRVVFTTPKPPTCVSISFSPPPEFVSLRCRAAPHAAVSTECSRTPPTRLRAHCS